MRRQSALLTLVFRCWSLLAVSGLCAQNARLEQAWSLAAKGERTDAIALLQKLIKEEPTNGNVYLLLGSLQSEAGQREEAITRLTEAVRLLPKSSEACNALGEAYNRFNDRDSARTYFERAVALNPKFGIAQENLGAVLLSLGQPAESAQRLDRAIALLGRSEEASEAHYLRSKIFTSEGKFNSAAEQLEKALEIRPDFPEAWSDLGATRSALSEDNAALSALRHAVALNPMSSIAQYRLGVEYLRRADPQSAVDPLEAAYKLDPVDQSTLNSLQLALAKVGRSEEAVSIRQKLSALLRDRDLKSQNAVKALQTNNEGSALEKAGDLPGALIRYREAVTLNPDHPGMRTNLAIALLRLGRWTVGLNELRAALELDPNNSQLKATLHDAISKSPPDLLPDWARSLKD